MHKLTIVANIELDITNMLVYDVHALEQVYPQRYQVRELTPFQQLSNIKSL